MTSLPANTEAAVGHLPAASSAIVAQPCVETKQSLKQRQMCRIARQTAWEMYALFSGDPMLRRNRRHAMQHIRQIAVYVCHVGLSMPLTEAARCFGRDAASIRATCLEVEERREEPGYDEFVGAVERLAKSISGILEGDSHAACN